MLSKSQEINELAKALSALQGELTDPAKDVQAFNYRYSNLTSAIEIGRPLLAKYGLAIIQGVGGEVCVHDNIPCSEISIDTMLIHTSGQWISTTLDFPVERLNKMTLAQSAGAVISYLRRYSYKALLGMTDADNDAADDHVPRKVDGAIIPSVAHTSAIHAKLFKLIELHAVSPADTQAWLDKANVKTLGALTEVQAAKLVNMLQARALKPVPTPIETYEGAPTDGTTKPTV